MNYEIIFTDTAESDLSDIALFIAEESKDKEVAKKFLGELLSHCKEQLGAYPLSGFLLSDVALRNTGYRFFVHREYIALYTVHEEQKTVYMHSVFNAKKDYTRIVKKLIRNQ